MLPEGKTNLGPLSKTCLYSKKRGHFLKMETFWGPYFWFWGTLFDFYFKIWLKLLYPPKTRPCHLSALMVFLKRLQVAIGKPAFLRSSGAQCPVFLIVFAVGIPWIGFIWLYHNLGGISIEG